MLERETSARGGLLCGDCMRIKIQILSAYGGEAWEFEYVPFLCSLPEAGCMMITCRRHILYDIASFKVDYSRRDGQAGVEPENNCTYQNICVSGWFTISVNTGLRARSMHGKNHIRILTQLSMY